MKLRKIKQLMENSRTNNFAPNLFPQLKDAGWIPTSLWKKGQYGSQNASLEDAEEIQFTTYEPHMDSVSIKIPAKKLVDFDYVVNAMAKKQNADSAYLNLANYMEKVLTNKSMNVYPTSYGVGVVSIFNKYRQSEIEEVKKVMDDLGLTYYNETSDAGWVYRFKVSKSGKNVGILQDLK